MTALKVWVSPRTLWVASSEASDGFFSMLVVALESLFLSGSCYNGCWQACSTGCWLLCWAVAFLFLLACNFLHINFTIVMTTTVINPTYTTIIIKLKIDRCWVGSGCFVGFVPSVNKIRDQLSTTSSSYSGCVDVSLITYSVPSSVREM